MGDRSAESPAPKLGTLYIFSGLPATGKTTLAQVLALRIGAAHLRIDTIEQALRDLSAVNVEDEGYRLAYRVAADILRAGVSVVADSCNPLELTRRDWENVAVEVGARYQNIEVVCSNAVVHRGRVERRDSTVPGLRLSTWQEVESREYQDWTVDRIVVDTSDKSPVECVEGLLSKLPD